MNFRVKQYYDDPNLLVRDAAGYFDVSPNIIQPESLEIQIEELGYGYRTAFLYKNGDRVKLGDPNLTDEELRYAVAFNRAARANL